MKKKKKGLTSIATKGECTLVTSMVGPLQVPLTMDLIPNCF